MTTPWTVGRGPILATDNDVQKADAINCLLIQPIGILPNKAGDTIKPFAVGLFDEIRTLLKPDVTTTALRRAIGTFAHSRRYFLACAQPNSVRYDIDGSASKPLTDDDRATAQSRFMAMTRKADSEDIQASQPLPSPLPEVSAMTKSEHIRAALLTRRRQ